MGPSGWMDGEYLGKLCGGEVAGTILKNRAELVILTEKFLKLVLSSNNIRNNHTRPIGWWYFRHNRLASWWH